MFTSYATRNEVRSEDVAVPVMVNLTEVKLMVPVGVSRKPDSTASAVPPATVPATGVPVLSIATVPVIVCWVPAAEPDSVPVVVTSPAAAMPPVNVAPAVPAAATSAMTR